MFASGQRGMRTYDRGVVVPADWTQVTLIADSTVRTLNLSGIVPWGTKFVELGLTISATANGMVFELVPGGYGTNENSMVYHERSTLAISTRRFWLPLPTDRTLDYWLQTGAWMQLYLTILAWKK